MESSPASVGEPSLPSIPGVRFRRFRGPED